MGPRLRGTRSELASCGSSWGPRPPADGGTQGHARRTGFRLPFASHPNLASLGQGTLLPLLAPLNQRGRARSAVVWGPGVASGPHTTALSSSGRGGGSHVEAGGGPCTTALSREGTYFTSSSTQSMDFVTAFFHRRIWRSRSAGSMLRLPALVLGPVGRAARPGPSRSRRRGRPRRQHPGPWSPRPSDGSPGTPRMSAWNCISASLATMPPSTFNSVSGTPESALTASSTSRVWKAVASRAARAMWLLLTKRVRPTMAPRASERQYGANRPENAGTMYTPPLSSTRRPASRPRGRS